MHICMHMCLHVHAPIYVAYVCMFCVPSTYSGHINTELQSKHGVTGERLGIEAERRHTHRVGGSGSFKTRPRHHLQKIVCDGGQVMRNSAAFQSM